MNQAMHSRALLTALGLASALTLAGPPLRAQSVVLTPSKDNTLIEDPDGVLSNGAGPVMFAGRVASGFSIRRAVLAFYVAGSVPPGSTIDAVTLSLTVNTVNNTTARDLTLFVLTADWGEGTSVATGGSGAVATANDATWQHTFYDSAFWTADGGDFVATQSATTSVADVGTYVWSSAQMVADVQAWLDAPATSHGWILIGDESAAQSTKRIASREDASPAARPQLTIEYTPPCTGAAVASRNAGANPASYSASPAVLGGTFSATVDNPLAGQTTSVLFAFDSPSSLTLATGQVLLCLDLGGNGELLTGAGLTPTSTAGGVDSYSIAVPDLPALCGVTLCTQALQLGVPPFQLSNAQDLTLGS